MIKDLFVRDINRSIQGVVTIGNEDEEQKWQELEEYVCTEEIIKAIPHRKVGAILPEVI